MRPLELEIEAVKLRILRMARDRNIDSAVLCAAIADVLGITAATLDLRVDAQDFDSRMDSIIERARAAYRLTHGKAARAVKVG